MIRRTIRIKDAVYWLSWLAVVVVILSSIYVIGTPSRRQFMADCTTARGSDDAGLRACAADWPRHLAAEQRDWRVP